MSKRLIPFIILVTLVLSSCGGDLSEPPLIFLVSDDGLVDGFQSSYCWDDGIAGFLCKDTPAPYFESSTPLDASAPIWFQLDTPLPKEVTLSISKKMLGESIFSETMPASEMIDWSLAIAPGEYIIYVHGRWKPGEVTYWFSVALE